MTDGDKLDIIYASLLEQSRNPQYAFGSLRGNWGYTISIMARYTTLYQRRLLKWRMKRYCVIYV